MADREAPLISTSGALDVVEARNGRLVYRTERLVRPVPRSVCAPVALFSFVVDACRRVCSSRIRVLGPRRRTTPLVRGHERVLALGNVDVDIDATNAAVESARRRPGV
uniref:Uncharacterized protein n=1 Tax=Plectus sambesii TaxID=2011161 RepID=A0A914XM63_9BILA